MSLIFDKKKYTTYLYINIIYLMVIKFINLYKIIINIHQYKFPNIGILIESDNLNNVKIYIFIFLNYIQKK